MLLKFPAPVVEFAETVFRGGYEIYLVGGAVRNIMYGLPPDDYDFTTNATPEQITSLFRKVIPTGIEHGTVTVLFKGFSFEITTYRIDGKYSDSRHPDKIVYSNDLAEDLRRRDFTINAMAIDVRNNRFIDMHNGLDDLKRKVIRAIGNPDERFAEDGLRILRACRFAAQMGFDIEPATREGMRNNRHRLAGISAERIRDEILKTMKADHPSSAFIIMKETGVLDYVLPELDEGYGMEQRELHRYDVFHHTLYCCDFAEKNTVLRVAALLHDIGKPRCLEIRDGVPTFYRHEEISARMAEDILRRLRFSKSEESYICHLIRNHMFHYTPDWSDGAVRRFVAKVKPECISDLFKLRLADRAAMSGVYSNMLAPEEIEFSRRIDNIIKQADALTVKDLKVNGNILASEAAIPKGPQMGTVLSFLLEAVLDDPALNEKEKLLELAVNFYKSRISL